MKKEIRAIGFVYGNTKNIIGVIFRGNTCFEGLIKIKLDLNINVTEEIVKVLKASPHFKQLRIIMFSENIVAKVNLQKIYEETKLPVIVVYKKPPIKNEELLKLKINKREIYVKAIGFNQALTKEALKNFTLKKADFPEPLRVAFLIAKALNNLEA
ncbi:MAG: DUF99 family protein [Candidatus Bathyarchaeia archaeon]|nr:DUF99 family protein [Candidatus Bathyarchaeota archaeon]